MFLCYCIVNHESELEVLFQDLKEYISKAGEVTFADAHKRRQGEGWVLIRGFIWMVTP